MAIRARKQGFSRKTRDGEASPPRRHGSRKTGGAKSNRFPKRSRRRRRSQFLAKYRTPELKKTKKRYDPFTETVHLKRAPVRESPAFNVPATASRSCRLPSAGLCVTSLLFPLPPKTPRRSRPASASFPGARHQPSKPARLACLRETFFSSFSPPTRRLKGF